MVAIPTAATTSAAARAGSERFALIDIAVMIDPDKPRIRIAPAAGSVDWRPVHERGSAAGRGSGACGRRPRVDTPIDAPVDPSASVIILAGRKAPVAELVDAPDSKSGGGNIVLVRVRPGAPLACAKASAGDPR